MKLAEIAEKRKVVRDANGSVIGWLVREGPITKAYDRNQHFLGHGDRSGTFDANGKKLFQSDVAVLLLYPCCRGKR